MSYFVIFLILLGLSLWEYCIRKRKGRKILFYLSGAVVLLFCSLRYDVGYDYSSYGYIFNALPDYFSLDTDSIKGEVLFKQLFILFKYLNIDYPIASSLTLLFINLLFLRFISKYSKYKCFSVLILFCWYFVYIFSTLRQGLALGVVLGIAVPFLEKKKYVKYYLTILLASFIHTSAIVCILFPFISRFSFLQDKRYLFLLTACLPFALIPNLILKTFTLFSQSEAYFTNSLSIGALLNRTLAFLIVYIGCRPKDPFTSRLKNIYLTGFLIYLILARSELIASRIVAYFKVFEIILIPLILERLSSKYYILFMIPIAIYLGFMLMNIISAIAFVDDFPDGWSYPYKTILEYTK